MSKKITKDLFDNLLKVKLGEQYSRALTIFKNYGKFLSFDVVNVLIHASEKDKIEDVLGELEKHWEEHLQYQHPDIRGTVHEMLGLNKTELMFLHVCKNILKL